MPNTARDRKKILSRINRLKGQLDSVSRKLDRGAERYQVLQVLASCRGAMQGLMADLIDDHLDTHVLRARSTRDARRAGREVREILRSFRK